MTRREKKCQTVVIASRRTSSKRQEEIVLIDCDACSARDVACNDCVVRVLLGKSDGSVEFDDAENMAVGALAAQGLVPPLRLVPIREITHRDIA